MKKEKSRRFRLIVLIIVICIITTLIVALIVINKIEKMTDIENRNNAYGIIETAKSYRIEKMLEDRPIPTNTNILDTLKVMVSKPKTGEVKVSGSGYVAVALQYGQKCYKKGYEKEYLTVVNNVKECKIDNRN